MPPRKRKPATTNSPDDAPVTDYRHAEKRKNIPPAGLAALAPVPGGQTQARGGEGDRSEGE